MSEGYARVSGHASASSPETLPLKRNAGIDDCQAGAISGCRSASGSLGGQTRLSARMSLIQFGIDERLLPRYAEVNASNSVGKRSLSGHSVLLGARGVQGLVTLWTLLSPAHHTIRIERKRLVSLQSIDVLSAPRPETRHTGHTTYSPPANRHVLGALEPSGIHFCFRGSFQRVAKPFQIDHQRATLH